MKTRHFKPYRSHNYSMSLCNSPGITTFQIARGGGGCALNRIRILPGSRRQTRIAAGEVVERPGVGGERACLKTRSMPRLHSKLRASIEIESGGSRMIRVTDDGCGMAHDDALLAFERHATSKLRSSDDLLSISTLGFRGEALPSMASVSRLLLETRAAEEENGTRVEFAGGKLVGVKPHALAGRHGGQRRRSFLLRSCAAAISEIGDHRTRPSLRW